MTIIKDLDHIEDDAKASSENKLWRRNSSNCESSWGATFDGYLGSQDRIYPYPPIRAQKSIIFHPRSFLWSNATFFFNKPSIICLVHFWWWPKNDDVCSVVEESPPRRIHAPNSADVCQTHTFSGTTKTFASIAKSCKVLAGESNSS